MYTEDQLKAFVIESNKIEGILREPTVSELKAHEVILDLGFIGIEDLQYFVSLIQPGAVLRDKPGLNVRVGNHYPIPGSKKVKTLLHDILTSTTIESPYEIHQQYETLHPFTDGNGRSGRVLWLKMMLDLYQTMPKLGFLHTWYYQSLAATNHRK